MGVSPLSVTTGQLTAGALIMLPVSLIVDQPWTHAFPPLSAWGAIIALALLCTAFGYVLYFRLIDRAGATNALLVTLLVPPVAILLGALFLGETLAPQDFVGLGLIALGLAAIDGRLVSLLCGGAGFRKQLSRLRARPVEVADVAPDFLALGVDTGSTSAAPIRPERARQRHLRILIGAEVGDLVLVEERHDRRHAARCPG